MSAMAMLVRRSWRRHAVASIFLAVMAGLVAALVGASVQAADRAATSLPRFQARSRVYDALVQGCPPGVDPAELRSQTDLLERCANPAVTRRLTRLLTALPDVVRTTGGATLVVALLDPSAPNHWGRLGLLEATTSRGARLDGGRPILVEGRNIDPQAPDEIVLSETAARSAGLHAGDTVRMAGWRQSDLDRAIDGKVQPETTPFRVRIVGVVRFLDDVQATGDVSLSDAILVGNVYAGPGWYHANGDDFSGYGTAAVIRLAERPGAEARVRRALSDRGWQTDVSRLADVSTSSPKKVIDIERRAVLAFAGIAGLAGLAFVGTTLVRQLRRETEEISGIGALGMTRMQLHGVNAARALTIAIPGAVVAVIGVVLLSPLGPVGFARRLEFDVGVRVDPLVLVVTATTVVVLLTALGATARLGERARRRVPSRPWRTTSASALGPVAAVGATIARGRSTRAAIAMTAVAVGVCIGAACLVASYDDLVAVPEHFGAWWDVAVGQYSERAPFEDAVASLRANPAVAAAAAYADETSIVRIDGRPAWLIGTTDAVGHHGPVMSSGRAPQTDHEVALGRATAAALRKQLGDDVVLSTSLHRRARLRVVGIAVVSDPIANDAKPDEGVVVRYPVLTHLTRANVPQSIVVALDRSHDRTRAIESLQRDFSGSIRAVVPQTDVRNVGRLRALPWLLAGLVAALALAALLHALLTILARDRSTLAVVGALGFTRAQRRAVATAASAGLTLVGVVIGVPLGLVLGARLWAAIANSMGLDTPVTWPWPAIIGLPAAALAGAALVGFVTARGPARVRPGRDLRVE
ncbi:MAG: FtsX-like permease family protein [Acidimicrobiia bacterium]